MRLEGLCRALQAELKAAKVSAGGAVPTGTKDGLGGVAVGERQCNGGGNGSGSGEESGIADSEAAPENCSEQAGKTCALGENGAGKAASGQEDAAVGGGGGSSNGSEDMLSNGADVASVAAVEVDAQAAPSCGDALVDGLPNDLY